MADKTIQMYVDDELTQKGYPITSASLVHMSSGQTVEDKLKYWEQNGVGGGSSGVVVSEERPYKKDVLWIKPEELVGNMPDVVDTLESISTTDALSANQGKRLKEDISNINAQLDEKANQIYQMDFVEFVKNRRNYKNMRFIKNSNIDYSAIIDNGYNFIRYNFVKDATDDFIKLHDATIGVLVDTYLCKKDGTLSGSFNTATQNAYTTVVGDSFTCEIKGRKLMFNCYKDNRGGIWEFVIDGDTTKTITISCYSATTIAENELLIIDGLDENKIHTVKATFKGADPLNPPSGGTARGWLLHYPSSPTKGTIVGYYSGYPTQYTVLAPYSNKEFAFSVTCGTMNDFVPEHSTPCAYNIDNPKFKLDGVVTEVVQGNFYNIKELELVQHCKVNKNNASNDIANFRITTNISINGVVTTSGSWTALQDMYINTGYPLMLPLGTSVNKVITSFNNSKVNAGDESFYHFEQEQDKCTSIALLNSAIPNIIGAGTIDMPMVTLRQKATTGKDLETSLRFWQRTTSPKLYFTSANALYLKNGEMLRWGGRLTVGEIENIFYTIDC